MFTHASRSFKKSVSSVALFTLLLSFSPISLPTALAANTDAVGTVSVNLIPNPSATTTKESVVVSFSGTGTLNLADWKVQDSHPTTYTFGAVSLSDGQSIKVCSGSGDVGDCDITSWTGSNVWNNEGDTLELLDENNAVIITITYGATTGDEEFPGSASVNYAPVACASQFDASGPTNIQNTDSGDYFDSISNALADCDTDNGDTIELLGNISTSEQITINRPIVLEGNGYILDAAFAKDGNSNNSAIGVQSDNVTIQNVIVDGANGTNLHGINVYTSTDVNISSVTTENFNTGLLVNGSTVNVSDIATDGNAWHAINVDRGSGVSEASVLNISNSSTHGEELNPHIFIDDISKADISVNDLDNQYDFVDILHPNTAQYPGVTARVYTLKETPAPTPGDTTDPVVEITNVVVSNDKKLSFDLVATDENSGLEIVAANIYNASNTDDALVTIGSGNPARLNIPHSGLPAGTLNFATSTNEIDVSGLPDGTYTIRAYARDHANNEHRFLTVQFDVSAVDTTSPVVTITNPIAGSVVSGEIEVEGVVTDDTALSHYVVTLYPGSTDLSSGLPHGSAIAVSGWGQVSTSTTNSVFQRTLDTTTLADGEYQIRVAARDAADNRDITDPYNGGTTSVHVVNIVVDNEPPTAPTITNPVSEQVFSATPILNQWTVANDDNGVAKYQIAYRYDDEHTFGGTTCPDVTIDGDWVGCRDVNGTSRNHSPALSEQGGVTIWVRAFDNAGNVSEWSNPVHYYYYTSGSLPVDEPPAVPTGLGWSDSNTDSVVNGGTTDLVAGTASWSANTEADFSHYVYRYWNAIPNNAYNSTTTAYVVNNGSSTSRSGSFNQGEGTHYFCVIAVDIAGNESECSDIFTVVYQTTPNTPPSFSFATTTVTASNMQGWSFNSDRDSWTMGPVGLVEGPSTTPLGLGSAMIGTNTNDDRTKLGLYVNAGISLDDITELSYSTYRTATSTGVVTTPALQFDVEFTHSGTEKVGRIVYEPYFNGTVQNDIWQNWNAIAGKWWIAGVSGLTNCTQGHATSCTWSELLSNYPDMETSSTSLENIDTQGAVLFKAGGAWGDFTGYVDNFVMGIKTGNNTHTETYDFEPNSVVEEEEEVSPVPTVTSSGSVSGGSVGSRSFRPTPSVLGASTDNFAVYSLLESIKQRLIVLLTEQSMAASNSPSFMGEEGQVLGESTTTNEVKDSEEEQVISEEAGVTSKVEENNSDNDETTAWYNNIWWLIILLLLITGLYIWRKKTTETLS